MADMNGLNGLIFTDYLAELIPLRHSTDMPTCFQLPLPKFSVLLN